MFSNIPEENEILSRLLEQSEVTENEVVPRIIEADNRVACNLSQSCKSYYSLFQIGLDIVHLCNSVVRGDKAEAKRLIMTTPEELRIRLLTTKATVTDDSHRKIFGTAWQIAAGAEDVAFQPSQTKCEEMMEMIERHLCFFENGKEILAEQKAEQFPQGWQQQEKLREEKDLFELKKVFEIIANSTTDAECVNGINEFINHLQPKTTITTGKHFNAKLLVHFNQLFAENYDAFGGENSRKNNLVSNRVRGGIQFNLPACYAQALCDGPLWNRRIIMFTDHLTRRLVLDDGKNFYDRSQTEGVGVNYSVDICQWANVGGRRFFGILNDQQRDYHERFAIFVLKKQQALAYKLTKGMDATNNNKQVSKKF